ncbi:arf-GAP with Rho-GAP domain, ANK repeat and PH domain-containing protein 1-like [Phasianus colchicus]|uniref:arf-GAP with Rho-GAP domain, ANK repeat and PH domain-containing protein 1-like n=1 Tax=Phasianus colchicus TaxID=9054 RepID=UPI00129D6B62|nr:arf-GAP with Rho-GAP domain, ANK repeat and PH domain-containing protein 1-like [Phasianus colchicus]
MDDPIEDPVPISSWLAALHLEQYSAAFQQHRLLTVADCRRLAEPDLTQIGVLLPGHRRRILLGLGKAFPPTPGSPHSQITKPIPAKRHVFRTPPHDPPVPPPVPPRLGCRPPLTFAPPPPSPLRQPVEYGVGPPLPAKRHHEGKTGTPEDPPALPPRTGGQQEGGSPKCAGWLDKMAPQGHYLYQRRWVTLDSQYLRYFASDKDAFSKRFIPVSSISHVGAVGDQKFEVVTQGRHFVFRADSDGEGEPRPYKPSDAMQLKQCSTADAAHAAHASQAMQLRQCSRRSTADAMHLKQCSSGNAARAMQHSRCSTAAAVQAGMQQRQQLSPQEQQQGLGITSIPMALGSVRDAERRSFQLSTPYGSFSFSAASQQDKEAWMAAMRGAVASALATYGVAERIWEPEANRLCADCGAPNPDWASINLCVVICERCAGEHRALGPNVSKVRSLKMDSRVWSEELIQVIGVVVGSLCSAPLMWGPSGPRCRDPIDMSLHRDPIAITPLPWIWGSGPYGVFLPKCGVRVPKCPHLGWGPYGVLLPHNTGYGVGVPMGFCCPSQGDLGLGSLWGFAALNVGLLCSEPPCPDLGCGAAEPYTEPLPCVTHCGFLYKTPSVAKPHSERRGQEEFSRRWCALQDGVLSYYENDRNAAPNGEIKVAEIVCLVNNPPHSHGIEFTFEVYIESERLYLFGSDNPDGARDWLRSLAKSFIPPCAEELLGHDFERLGRLMYKGGLSLERPEEGWFALVGSTLHVCSRDGQKQEAVQLRKLQELSIQGDNEVLVLVERRRLDYRGGDGNGVPPLLPPPCRVQRFAGDNQMNTHNLAIVFGPTLFQTDGQDYKAGRVVEELIGHYVEIFNVCGAGGGLEWLMLIGLPTPPPHCSWGFTVFHENEKHDRQQWYLCCDTQADLREWFATFLHVQTGGALWPSHSLIGRPSRRPAEARLSSAPLIRLRRPDSVSGAALYGPIDRPIWPHRSPYMAP